MPLESIPFLLLAILIVQILIWWGQPLLSVYRRILEAFAETLNRLEQIDCAISRLEDELKGINRQLEKKKRDDMF